MTCLTKKCRSMRDNLVLHNIEETRGENVEGVARRFIEQQMKVDTSHMEIMRCHRLGPQRGKDRPIVANFLKHTDKESIRRSSSVLKSTKFGVSDHQQDIRDCLQNVNSQNSRPTSQSSADPTINNIDPYPGHGPRVTSTSLPNWPPRGVTSRPRDENSRGVPTSNRFSSLSNDGYPNPASMNQWPGFAPTTRSAGQSTTNTTAGATGVNTNNQTRNTSD